MTFLLLLLGISLSLGGVVERSKRLRQRLQNLMREEKSCSLLFAMNTVERKHQEDYLISTVNSVMNQINARSWNLSVCENVQLLVMNQKIPNVRFSSLQASDNLFLFENSRARSVEPHSIDQPPVDDNNNAELRPGPLVRQQSWDLLSIVDKSLQISEFRYIVLSEDDAPLCPGALEKVIDELYFADRFMKGWSVLRTSVGFIGIVMSRESVLKFRAFLHAYYMIKPPDLLLSQFQHGTWPGSCAVIDEAPTIPVLPTVFPSIVAQQSRNGPPRPFLTSRENLFLHLGSVSTLRDRVAVATPQCGKSLSSSVFDPKERFRPECAAFLVSPCTQTSSPE
jgi:hypothetical protein